MIVQSHSVDRCIPINISYSRVRKKFDMEMETPPPQFVCPISLTRMQDPVTAPSGITYDRGAIERWLAAGHDTCPVTGRGPLSLADLTPNLTLRRLILSWPNPNSNRHPPALTTPDQPDSRNDECGGPAELVKKLMVAVPAAKADAMARRSMIPRVLPLFVSSCATEAAEKKKSFSPSGVEAACLALLDALGVSADEIRPHLLPAEPGFLDALTHVLVTLTLELQHEDYYSEPTLQRAVRLLESATEASTPALLDRLRPDLLRALTAVLHARRRVPLATTRAALKTILNACAASSRNLRLAAESGVAHEAIELELSLGGTSRATTELVMAVLSLLCSGSAEARATVAGHAAGIAVVAKRVLLRGGSSAAGDAAAVRVLASVCGRGASPETVREMARVGAVGKLCCVLQAECDQVTKEAARRVLRMHAGDWAGSPCVSAYLLSRYL
ncbi:hypothetical protein BRADI_2g10920v3 [Brachypodium distachyon]|uniref:U-box domain-containing protein n=1 Tax=Brachypodium distachyon TaxID=15368 RepID=A0A2K2D7V4_BRADI|nr:hypothetical protein BRADI_2g10920v3 [Brachypodium distachyon]